MPELRFWLPLIVALVLNAAANVLLKVGARSDALAPAATVMEKATQFFNAVTVVAIIIFALNILFYRKALEGIPLSIGYPIMLSGSLLLATLAARFLPMLRERISPLQIAGMVLIVLGVWMVSQQPKGTEQPDARVAIVQPGASTPSDRSISSGGSSQ